MFSLPANGPYRPVERTEAAFTLWCAAASSKNRKLQLRVQVQCLPGYHIDFLGEGRLAPFANLDVVGECRYTGTFCMAESIHPAVTVERKIESRAAPFCCLPRPDENGVAKTLAERRDEPL